MKIFNESGRGYWLEGFGCIRAGGGYNDMNTSHAVVIGCDLYNQAITGEKAVTLTAHTGRCANSAGPSVLILNDQGGRVMDVSENVTATLRAQEHGHSPVVCMAFDVYNMQGNSSVFKTLNHIATDSDHIPIACYSLCNHDCSSNENITETLRAESHGALPIVCFEPGIMSRDCSAGNRAYFNICSTLRAEMGDNRPAVCYETDCE